MTCPPSNRYDSTKRTAFTFYLRFFVYPNEYPTTLFWFFHFLTLSHYILQAAHDTSLFSTRSTLFHLRFTSNATPNPGSDSVCSWKDDTLV